MIFNSYTFVAFFIIILILHHLPISWKFKKINLLIASYIFYAAWNPPFILLLWLSTVIDFFVGKALFTQDNPYKKKLLFVISLIGNLGMLCFFKYGTFLLENFVSIVNLLGFEYHPATPSIILPAGISFYTFTTLCYTIDMYHKRSEPVKSMLDFSLFVTFFPHLVAGPIVRPPQLVPQFETERVATQKQIFDGLLLLSLGLFMKVVLADGMLSETANAVFNSTAVLPALDAWIGVLAFSGQIFLDFAGYSTCAIGVALCLGFVLPQNFNYPYAALGFSDFWKRWHITLSSWLKDYLYIPLGGNRHGKLRTYYALMVTMLLGGLWHGANWTFVAWGGLHGFYLWIEKYLRDRKKSIQHKGHNELNISTKESSWIGFFYALLTFMLVNITWVFFRSNTFSKAWQMLISMSGTETDGKALLTTLAIIKVAVIIPLIVITHWLMRNTKVLEVAHQLSWWKLGIAWSTIILLLIWSQESGSSFIYFQF
ncbi:MBOAT family O-acyltransferase [Flavobacterium taihuense]|uniref:MBOAT family protein n=1 Tax=Flavobacterium taihuense TaxID=2857508 RepID=A0ABS6XWJ8_9FLAO|nr:MBOAT family O-acyltransferase [Flavobacterium taihuense]MBW4360939.1 MBOAT family protein [Flavobacterium taihuense]